ncbi:MAG: protein phosphatase 2C domain-containing protein [Arcobacter sp.]|uniref:protein phosphatase 2C domain-containing protein n=1 Tax=Arcobacter sp. TaxID=1872629 RepID=UPI003B00D107
MFSKYKIASAITQGVSHKKTNTKCQDAILTLKKDNFIFLGVADGAGSKKEAYTASWFILNILALEFENKLDKYLDSKNINEKILSFLESSLYILSKYSKLEFEELSSTLLFALILENEYIIGHIGDGIIVNITQDNRLNILSKPENGEFSNETYFCNTIKYKNRLRIYRGDVADIHNGLLLCSDGVEDAIYDYNNDKVIDVCSKFINWLDSYEEEKVCHALQHNLENNVSRVSNDDLSVILLKQIV